MIDRNNKDKKNQLQDFTAAKRLFTILNLAEWGSHNSEYEDGCFLGCCTDVSQVLAASIISKMKTSVNFCQVGFEVLTVVSTKMSVFWAVAPCSLENFYQTTQHGNPEDSYL
jgi:hypothetical protein